jgi:hypothetical protein
MNVRMAIHTRPSEHAIALFGGDFVLVVQRRRMSGRDVAALAEHGHSHDEHPIVR